MGERKWTSSQKAAIDTRDRTLLVSAAAGSGKTAVLTERIIKSLLDEENPISIEEMLVVTYTRAAVGELSERIGRAIKDAIKRDPGNERIQHQLHMLSCAKICTIDSFCADILRANAERVGISPSFRVPDGAEVELLCEHIIDGLLNEVYEGELPEVATPEEIDMLTDCLAGARRQNDMPAIIRHIYEPTKNALDGVGEIGKLVEEYNPDKFTSVEETGFGKYIMRLLSEMLAHYKSALKSMMDEADQQSGDPKINKIIDMLDDTVAAISELEKCKTYEEARAYMEAYPEIPTVSIPSKYNLPPITQMRREFKERLEEVKGKYFFASTDDWRISYTALYNQFTVLYRLICEFDRRLRNEKLHRGICEFSDIERYTYECLWQNGEKTDVALAQAGMLKAVYIDEYQDVNSLQNKIFEAISTDTDRFMVGDIKQSIYEFRSANPKIFADMKKTYPKLGEEGDYPYASVFMSDNFRCDEGVIDFVNTIFDRIFHHLRESIGYVDADRLHFSKVYEHGTPDYRYPEICIVNGFSRGTPRDSYIEDKSQLAPEVTARKIKELIDTGYLDNGEKIQPRHIAIVMRMAKHRAEKYVKELDKLGIPSAVAEDARFFLGPDVLLVLCLLNSIDNPHKDIYLTGLMSSPLYGFTLGEIAVMRKKAPADSLYETLRICAEDDIRVEKFLERLEYYRLISEGMPTDKLIMKLYHDTGVLALAISGTESRDNLMLLYEHARRFESGSFKGLYNFISYINQLVGRKNDFDKREAPDECDAVRIITAHSSKGLEYPIVFFVGGEALFSRSGGGGEAPRFEYEEGFGIGMYPRTPSGLGLVRNVTKDVIKDYRYRKRIEEEARILYVILTRARERLYVVANVGVNPDGFKESADIAREYMSGYSIYNTDSFISMIASAGSFELKSPREFLKNPPFVYTEEAEAASSIDELREMAGRACDYHADKKITGGPDIMDEEQTEVLLKRRFGFEYPDDYLTRIPGKLSVSKLYPAILDGTDIGTVHVFGDDNGDTDNGSSALTLIFGESSVKSEGDGGVYEKGGKLPSFRSHRDEDESAKRGIATHMLLQFCDLLYLKENGAEAELERQKKMGFLSKSDAGLVRIKEIEKFVKSKLLTDMLGASKIYRELRFNVKLPASGFTTDEGLQKLLANEHVLVQGVIDCLWVDKEGEYHLIDYKTDRLSSDEFSSKEIAKETMKGKHGLQLSYYAEAVELMFGKYPASIEVYSLPLGDTLDVSLHGEK